MLGGIIGGALGAAGKAVGMGLQANQNKKNQEREDKIRQQTWAREDNAVQRRAEDMKKAVSLPRKPTRTLPVEEVRT